LARAFLASGAFLLLVVFAAGCGSAGVEQGALVTVYAGAPVCPGAKRELAHSGDEAGSVRVRVLCAPATQRGGRLDLATVGADARRSVEDSRAVAYLEAPGATNRFAAPILEEAQIALVTDRSGSRGMARILAALESRGSSESPREAVWAAR
jgi:hypothetical protein